MKIRLLLIWVFGLIKEGLMMKQIEHLKDLRRWFDLSLVTVRGRIHSLVGSLVDVHNCYLATLLSSEPDMYLVLLAALIYMSLSVLIPSPQLRKGFVSGLEALIGLAMAPYLWCISYI